MTFDLRRPSNVKLTLMSHVMKMVQERQERHTFLLDPIEQVYEATLPFHFGIMVFDLTNTFDLG